MTIAGEFSKYVVELSFAELPKEILEPTKKQILDTLGCAIAGTSHEVIEPVADLYKNWGGKEESTIFVYGGKVPCMGAALVNGWLAGVTDFDDYNDVDMPHVSRENVPACFAMAERIGKVNGRDFLVAVAIGYDISCRLSRAVWYHYQPGSIWDPSTLFAFFGCAASTGKLLGLNQEQISQAFSLALGQASGLLGGVVEGMNSKGLSAGRAAAGGIFSALLAERGITGADNPFEGGCGLYDAFFHNVYSKPMITVDLGKVFAARTSAFKPYPCCGFMGTPVDGALALVTENDIKPDDVSEVNIQSGRDCVLVAEPRDAKLRPDTPVASEFSLQWGVANAIIDRRLGLEHFTEKAIHENKQALALAQKVNFKLNPYFRTCEDMEPSIVEIKTKDGKVYSNLTEIRYGHYKNPMSWDAIVDKFRDCCRFSTKPIAEDKQHKIIQMVDKLEDVADVCQIARLMA